MEDEECVIAGDDFFPSINQFRNAVKAERDHAIYHGIAPRKRRFLGTVKLHGTNAGISCTPDGEIIYRSRSRIITPDDDNYGFARHMASEHDTVCDVLSSIASNGQMVTIFGEWCGAGVQGGVAIGAERKMFVVFAARVGDEWIDESHVERAPWARIFNIHDYPTWSMEIDFDKPEQAQNDLCALTEEVERECPVAKAFGHSGIGEGIVWTPADDDRRSRFWFKVKGEKHSASKVKVLAAVDVERFRARDELIAALVTDNRLAQGLDLHINEFKLPVEMSAIGEYLRWVFSDIVKEDADTIAASGFEVKELGKGVSDIAKRYYIAAVSREGLSS